MGSWGARKGVVWGNTGARGIKVLEIWGVIRANRGLELDVLSVLGLGVSGFRMKKLRASLGCGCEFQGIALGVVEILVLGVLGIHCLSLVKDLRKGLGLGVPEPIAPCEGAVLSGKSRCAYKACFGAWALQTEVCREMSLASY